MAASKGVIGILTGGGDVPGLNPAIRAVTIRALHQSYRNRLRDLSPQFNRGRTIDVVKQKLGYLTRSGDPDAIDSIVPMAYGTVDSDLRELREPADVHHDQRQSVTPEGAPKPVSGTAVVVCASLHHLSHRVECGLPCPRNLFCVSVISKSDTDRVKQTVSDDPVVLWWPCGMRQRRVPDWDRCPSRRGSRRLGIPSKTRRDAGSGAPGR